MPVDYLAIGHVSADLTADGPRLGGTVTFSALTALAFSLCPAIVTSAVADAPLLHPLAPLSTAVLDCPNPTTFENVYDAAGTRTQTLLHHAAPLALAYVPPAWRSAPLVHLAPVAREVDPALAHQFPDALVCVTPQGWMREWDGAGRVAFSGWPDADTVLRRADAVVLSIDDVEGDEALIEAFARSARLLAVTRGSAGCSLYTGGTRTDLPSPPRTEYDPTGAGDIFAASFFVTLHRSGDPLHAARVATWLAGQSVERVGLAGIPTPDEVQVALSKSNQMEDNRDG